ncbi:putative UDP-N-acetylglucosamine--peptide N-acetylglucosaminyltransferase SPINDLY [Apostasia shenzhenica]|uniref:Putative UDP-N-acetylglucosamine--peptide N-acetylglucosaminyltransferase SPINDLY n=1 Tax=Apostasia shenzhenica TaxID=1088818 RepID=A0A2I0BD94_9ASPA|nr:putative UDP-N-acetylglucosamine--peptide N-acetylglucosaminyltransferase SPINDLY [Apostasia shenzhenica]
MLCCKFRLQDELLFSCSSLSSSRRAVFLVSFCVFSDSALVLRIHVKMTSFGADGGKRIGTDCMLSEAFSPDIFHYLRRKFEGKEGDALCYANVLLKREKFVAALVLYEVVLENVESNLDALVGKGVCLKELGLKVLASDVLTEGLKLDPENARALTQLGALHKSEGRLHQAAELYEKAMKADPSYRTAAEFLAAVLTDIGTNLKLAGKTDEQCKIYSMIIKLYLLIQIAYCNLGLVHSETMEFDLALGFYENAALKKPMYPEVYCNMGVIHKNRGDLEIAIVCYER